MLIRYKEPRESQISSKGKSQQYGRVLRGSSGPITEESLIDVLTVTMIITKNHRFEPRYRGVCLRSERIDVDSDAYYIVGKGEEHTSSSSSSLLYSISFNIRQPAVSDY